MLLLLELGAAAGAAAGAGLLAAGAAVGAGAGAGAGAYEGADGAAGGWLTKLCWRLRAATSSSSILICSAPVSDAGRAGGMACTAG